MFLLLAMLTCVYSFNDTTQWNMFAKFRDQFHRKYSSLQEFETRFAIFKENIFNLNTQTEI